MPIEILFLSRRQIETLGVSIADVIDAMETALAAHGRGRTQMPPTAFLGPGNDVFLRALVAYVPEAEAAGLKWAGGAPHNHRRGLPLTSGIMVLNDPETALPLAIMDAALLTALRSPAVSAVAARRLARPEAAVLAIVGAGVQGRGHLIALTEVLPRLKEVRVYDRRPEATARLCAEFADRPWEVKSVAGPREAIEGADVVVTATASVNDGRPFVQPEWLKAGCFGIPMEQDCAWGHASLAAADKFITDDWQHLQRIAAGEFPVRSFREGLPRLHAELGPIVAGLKPGRENPYERIVALNCGLGVEDVVVARRIYQTALIRGAGTRLELA